MSFTFGNSYSGFLRINKRRRSKLARIAKLTTKYKKKKKREKENRKKGSGKFGPHKTSAHSTKDLNVFTMFEGVILGGIASDIQKDEHGLVLVTVSKPEFGSPDV